MLQQKRIEKYNNNNYSNNKKLERLQCLGENEKCGNKNLLLFNWLEEAKKKKSCVEKSFVFWCLGRGWHVVMCFLLGLVVVFIVVVCTMKTNVVGTREVIDCGRIMIV
jgi:hypothetical protein